MSVNPVIVLGTFPVTQQVVGLGSLAFNLAMAVASLAKLTFYKIKSACTAHNNIDIELKRNIKKAGKDLMMWGIGMIGSLLVITPIVGTIVCAKAWYQEAKKQQRAQAARDAIRAQEQFN